MNKIISILLLIISILPSYSFSFFHIGSNEGLSHPTVLSICQDDLGRIWFGTREGLNIYNGHEMKVFIGNATTPSGKKLNIGSHISSIQKDSYGNMYILAERNLFQCNIEKNYYAQLTDGNATSALCIQGDSIWYIDNERLNIYRPSLQKHHTVGNLSIKQARSIALMKNKIFIGTIDGLHILSQDGALLSEELEKEHIFKLFKSSQNELWIGTAKNGIYKYTGDQLTKIPYNIVNQDYTNNSIRDFIEDTEGNIWIGTSNGLCKYNLSKDTFYVVNPPQYLGGFKDPSIYSLYFDNQNNIWTGTIYGGASYFNPLKNRFTDYEYQSIDPSRTKYRIIGQMTFDNRGNLWSATEGEGVFCLNQKCEIIQRFHTETAQALASNHIKALTYDEKKDQLYIGTQQGGLSIYDFNTKRLTTHQLPDIKSKTDHNNIIYHLELANNKLYLSTPKAIYSFDPLTNKFTHISQVPNFCYNFKINDKGILFARVNHSMKIIPLSNPEDTRTVDFSPDYKNVKISSFVTTQEGVYILTYGNGIFHYNINNGKLENYHKENSNLPTDYCYIGKYTQDNKIAITCSKGIILFNPALKTFALINRFEKRNPILRNSGLLISPQNYIYIGGTKGITKLNLDEVGKQVNKKSALYFSDLHINNKLIQPNQEDNILTTRMPYTKSIHLNADENNIVIDLAYKNCTEEHYWKDFSYKLEGLDRKWNRSTDASIRYNHLAPGSYTLLVKKNVPEEAPITELHIYIASPWYARWWAICLYIGLAGVALYIFHQYRRRHQKLMISLENEKFEKKKIEQLNHEKMVFFTNISHEFRTPLTLIISHVDSLLAQQNIPVSIYNVIYKIKKNSIHMNNLVSELLDFKKFSQNSFTLNVTENNYVSYIEELYLMYSDFARQRNITFTFEPQTSIIKGWFDTKQMDKVFFNLLSNAFKYTLKDGKISVSLKEEDEQIRIEITDTGVGISKEDIKRLFNRFYQGNNQQGQEHSPGTGIGLALTKLIVEKHHGTISVESEQGKGSTFILQLPLNKEAFLHDEQILFLHEAAASKDKMDIKLETSESEETEAIAENMILEKAENDETPNRRTILIVEDNWEVMKILVKLFKDHFQVAIAKNGKEGLEKTFELKPDLIISDIMMPEMNGTEMCLQIKNNIDLCHIPIILLTALTSEQQNIEGLNRGADDYICKPFNAQLLLARVNSLIRNRLLIQAQISKKPITDIDLTSINPLDLKFLKKTEEILKKNLDNTEFGLADLCVELSMGRSLLFNKFKAITGMTPNKYILNFRLKHAASLLHHHPDILITEVSDRCGFGSAIYFSRCFKNQYGVSPQNYKKQDTQL